MKKRYRILSLALLSACLIGCSGDAISNPSGDNSPASSRNLKYLTAENFNPDRAAGAVSDEFRAAYADLTLKLLTSCRGENGRDTMISPLSIMTALAMTANGADGNTLAQMETLLSGDPDIEALNQQIFNFYSSLSSTAAASFKAANSIWLTTRSHYTVKPDFIGKMENTFDADIIGIDFADSQNAADSINYWCNQKTDGMIPSIVSPDNFNELTIMALLNALSFDAQWADPYEDYQCSDGIFHGANGDTDVTMMSDAQHSGYIEGERERGFIRYYKGGDYAFVALLPNEKGDISDYLASLSGSYLLDLIQNPVVDPNGYTLHTKLPAFKQETSLDLNGILEKLGMTDAFYPEAAEFGKLGHFEIGNVYIDKVIHKTFIEVNNMGTRAAAITAVIAPGAAAPPARKETVILDRPFVYAIIDTATSLPIFIGSCENVT